MRYNTDPNVIHLPNIRTAGARAIRRRAESVRRKAEKCQPLSRTPEEKPDAGVRRYIDRGKR